MYPAKLYLKNFLSYGDQGVEIDFTGYQILLLIGKNGAGKSSILDAILWALWGQTRSGGDNDIMHSGSSDMEVRLDFVVRDARYRVVRKRSKKGKSFVSVLELQSLTEPITVLTDATIIQTQTRIDELIGVDYELLVNSAFLRQGQAQEFTQKSPTKRKQLLATLLGLEKYAQYHEQAKKNLKQIEIELAQLERDIAAGEQTTLHYEQEINLQRNSLSEQNPATLATEIEQQEKILQGWQLKTQLVAEWKQRFDNNEQKKLNLTKKISNTQTLVKQIEAELIALQSDLAAAPQAINQQEWESLEQQFHESEQLLQKHQDLTYRIQTNQTQLQRLATDTDNQQQSLQTKIAHLQNTITEVVTTDNVEGTRKQLEQVQAEQLAHAQTIAKLEQQMQSIVDQGNQINKRKDALATINDQCPLCEQHIDSNHKHTITEKYTLEREALLATYQELKTQLEIASAARAQSQTKTDTLQTTLKAQQTALNTYQVQQAQQESLLQQLAVLQSNTADQKAKYEHELSVLQQELTSIGFNQNAWETIKTKRAELQQAQLLANKHTEKRLKLQELEQNKKFHTSTISDAESELIEINAQLQILESQRPQAGDQEEIIRLEQALNNLKKQHQYLIQLEALINQREKDKTELANKIAQFQETKTTQQAQYNALTLLVEALGNKGIPQMLIEESIPRLEQYANETLSHLSDNTMSIKLSLTRPSKTDRDTQIETLDILIGDSVGTRAYELFSGGEAFRIDIALRIALTKLLTEHTHGSVDFLVIDEGFGSQDDSGNDLITHIIHQLQQYFHLILIITHVDQLKETFPDRLVIKKGPQGSEIFYDED